MLTASLPTCQFTWELGISKKLKIFHSKWLFILDIKRCLKGFNSVLISFEMHSVADNLVFAH